MRTSVSTKPREVCLAKTTPTVLLPAPGMPISTILDRISIIISRYEMKCKSLSAALILRSYKREFYDVCIFKWIQIHSSLNPVYF